MDSKSNQINIFLINNSKYLEQSSLPMVKKKLMSADESILNNIAMLQFKSPEMVLVLSILVGTLGIDRFIIGDVGWGIAKLLTCGGFGILTIIDWFLIMPATKKKNMEKLQMFLG